MKDRIQLPGTGWIDYGIFYYEDAYPDSHLYQDGEFLRKTYDPDFMLYHSMNIDYWGHQKGGESKEYAAAVASVEEMLSPLVNMWMGQGYQVVITADHGMGEMGLHGGTTPAQRELPLYLFSHHYKNGRFTQQPISQLSLAPLLCSLLEVPPSGHMIEIPHIEKRGDGSEE